MPMDRSRYPDNWEAISHHVRFERADGKCEWCGVEHGAIGARNQAGEFIPLDVIDRCQTMQSDAGFFYLEKLGFPNGDYPDLIKIVLTTAHLGIPRWPGDPGDKHNKMDVRLNNLKALCQKCHLNFDRDEHRENARRTRQRKRERTLREAGHRRLPGW